MNKKRFVGELLATLALMLNPIFAVHGENFHGEGTPHNVTCGDISMPIWDSLKEKFLHRSEIKTLSLEDISSQVVSDLLSWKILTLPVDSDLSALLKISLRELIQAVVMEPLRSGEIQNSDEMVELLSGLDVGDETTALKKKLKPFVQQRMQGIQKILVKYGIICGSRQMDAGGEKAEVSAIGGARWAMKTAYQTCAATDYPALRVSDPDLDGIKTECCHRDKVGYRRTVTALDKVLATHYYMNKVTQYGPQCFDIRHHPLIYDYGGRPFVKDTSATMMDLFTNSGSGTNVLGIDCSAFIFTSMGVAGLKTKSNRPLKAIDVYAYSSHSYLDPKKNGLTCLAPIAVSSSSLLKVGDIMAVPGHVFMVDSLGEDPFAMGKTRSIEDCSQLSAKDFDFVIIQSSNSHNGVGINRFQVADYLLGAKVIAKNMELFAQKSCQAKWLGKTLTPQVPNFSIVRHLGTEECRGPRLRLTNEACVATCLP